MPIHIGSLGHLCKREPICKTWRRVRGNASASQYFSSATDTNQFQTRSRKRTSLYHFYKNKETKEKLKRAEWFQVCFRVKNIGSCCDATQRSLQVRLSQAYSCHIFVSLDCCAHEPLFYYMNVLCQQYAFSFRWKIWFQLKHKHSIEYHFSFLILQFLFIWHNTEKCVLPSRKLSNKTLATNSLYGVHTLTTWTCDNLVKRQLLLSWSKQLKVTRTFHKLCSITCFKTSKPNSHIDVISIWITFPQNPVRKHLMLE